MRALLVVMALVGVLAAPAAAEIVGRGRALDGDTLALGGLTLRLFGIDAPETDQTCGAADGADWACGAAAAARLAALIEGVELACVAEERDRYGRVVATCFADGRDLGAALVAEGLAWAYLRYSDAYAGLEAEARAAARGLWQGPALAAWDWRRAEGFRAAAGAPAAAPDAAAPEGCAIKGNINARGGRIYHTPASRDYVRTVIDEAKGERWFCDEAEARAAGWRPAGGG